MEKDVCVCEENYTGDLCETEIKSCETKVCSSYGSLQEDNTCRCDDGYTGLFCENELVTPCTPECGEHGICSGGTCHCENGWKGTDCSEETTACDVKVCSSHGDIQQDMSCQCDDGFTGVFCENELVTPCTPECGEHGICSGGACHCENGWKGTTCSEEIDKCEVTSCSTHGSLQPDNSCLCEAGFTGLYCENELVTSCNPECSEHGLCSSGNCYCENGWKGTDCSEDIGMEQVDSPVDKENKTPRIIAPGSTFDIFIKPDKTERFSMLMNETSDVTMEITSHVADDAVAALFATNISDAKTFADYVHVEKLEGPQLSDHEYKLIFLKQGRWIFGVTNGGIVNVSLTITFLTSASPPRCPSDCSNRGLCRDGSCICEDGWTGEECLTVAPVVCIPNNCAEYGHFTDGQCLCDSGWTGEYCEEELCLDPSCSGNGVCQSGQCICGVGWKGEICGQRDCIPRNCNDHGTCIEAECKCDGNWQGDVCNITFIDCPKECILHGQCNNVTGFCACDLNWEGANCNIRICDSCVNGDCNNGTCDCDEGWYGDECNLEACSAGCDIHGTCDNGVCRCDRGWTSVSCKKDGCPDNCSGNGECESDGVVWSCECFSGFRGDDCIVGTESTCDDDIDNDKDQLTDCDDPDCCVESYCKESISCADEDDPLVPPQNNSATQTFSDKVRFILDQGLQLGIDESKLNDELICVLRGEVVTHQRIGLPGVNVTVIGKPHLGSILTRNKGKYDIILNCGGRNTLNFARHQFISSQRRVDTVTNQIRTVDQVALRSLDNKATQVNLTANEATVVTSSVTKDVDGERTARLLFPPNTTVTVLNENGRTMDIETPTVRMTEYTEGRNGLNSMPAVLPPNVAYTYCLEISIDEASVDRSTEVTFNQRVPFYLDNYLTFPVGSAVPVGFYDRKLGEWVTAPDGRVIRVLEGTATQRQVDVNGYYIPAIEQERMALGISDEVLEQLMVYDVNHTLWFATITHLTPYDCNFPYGPPPGGCSPSECDDLPEPEDDPCKQGGSGSGRRRRSLQQHAHYAEQGNVPESTGVFNLNIDRKSTMRKLQNNNDETELRDERYSEMITEHGRDLTPPVRYHSWEGNYKESDTDSGTCAVRGATCGRMYDTPNHDQTPSLMTLGIEGTSLDLIYTYFKQPGYKSILSIPISGPNLPEELIESIQVEVMIAGVLHSKTLPVKKNQVYTFVWDRRDAYGRFITGNTYASVRIGYEYGLVYYASRTDFGASFNRFSSADLNVRVSRSSQSALFWVNREVQLNVNTLSDMGLGGWTLAIQHTYDAVNDVVYKGTGESYQSKNENAVRTIVGTGVYASGCQACGEGPGTEARITAPMAVVHGPDYDIYFGDNDYIRRYHVKTATVSTITKLSWSPRFQYFMTLNRRDNSLLLSDPNTLKVYTIDIASGVISVLAGTGEKCTRFWQSKCGDNGPANQATFVALKGIAVGQDGNIFVVDHKRIRQIGNDQLISPYVGTNIPESPPTKGPSSRYDTTMNEAYFRNPTDIAVDLADETMYITDDDVLLKLTKEGRIKRISGYPEHLPRSGSSTFGSNQNARDTTFKAPLNTVTLGPNGKIYIAESQYSSVNRIYRIDPGTNSIEHIAGTETECECQLRNCDCFGKDGSLLKETRFHYPSSISVSSSGQIVFADMGNRRIRSTKIYDQNSVGTVGLQEYVVPDTSQTKVHVFNPRGLHQRTVDLVTGQVEFEFLYDDDENLERVIDKFNRTLTLDRRSNGDLHAFVAPGGERSVVTLDTNGRLQSMTSEMGQSAVYMYDDQGLMIEHQPPSGCNQQYEYDEYGRLTYIRNGDDIYQHFWEISDSTKNTIKVSTSLTGRQGTIDRSVTGSLLTTTSTVGAVRMITRYDQDTGIIYTMHPNEMTLEAGHGPSPIWSNSITVPTYYMLSTPNGKTKRIDMDNKATFENPTNPLTINGYENIILINGKPVQTTHEDYKEKRVEIYIHDDSTKILSLIKYFDDHGRLIRVSQPYHGIDDITINYTDKQQETIVDTLQGRLTKETIQDENDNVILQRGYDGIALEYDYGDYGREIKMILPSGRFYTFSFDNCSTLVNVRMPNGATHILRSGSDAGQINDVYKSPLSSPYSVRSLSNFDGELRKELFSSSKGIRHTYDEGYRPTSLKFDNSETVFEYKSLSGHPDPENIMRYENGQLSNEIHFERDGALLTKMGVLLHRRSTDYDAEFNYEYNSQFLTRGIISEIADDTFVRPIVRNNYGEIMQDGYFQYTRTQREISFTDNILDCEYTMDGNGLLSSHTCSILGEQIYRISLQRGQNVSTITQQELSIGESTHRIINYKYDLDGQLIQVKEGSDTTEEYDYDVNGNKVSWTTNGNSHTAIYDSEDKLTKLDSDNYLHNTDGYMSNRAGDTPLYNTKGELIKYTFNKNHKSYGGEHVDYRYDGLHRLVERRYNQDLTNYYYGDSQHPIRLTHYTHNKINYAVYYDHRGFAALIEDTNGNINYIMTDHIGTPLAVFDISGQLLKEIIYDAFGNILHDSAPNLFLPIGFAGGLRDPATNLIRFHFRDYDPILGQWTARDPSLFSSQQPNLYQYVFNDPINLRDPLGLFCAGVEGYGGGAGGGGSICLDGDGWKVCGEAGLGAGGGYSFDPFGSSGADNPNNLGWSLTGQAEASISAGGQELYVGGEVDILGLIDHWRKTGKLDPCFLKAKVGAKQTALSGEQLTTEIGYSNGNLDGQQNYQLTKPPGSLDPKIKASAKATIKGCYTGRW